MVCNFNTSFFGLLYYNYKIFLTHRLKIAGIVLLFWPLMAFSWTSEPSVNKQLFDGTNTLPKISILKDLEQNTVIVYTDDYTISGIPPSYDWLKVAPNGDLVWPLPGKPLLSFAATRTDVISNSLITTKSPDFFFAYFETTQPDNSGSTHLQKFDYSANPQWSGDGATINVNYLILNDFIDDEAGGMYLKERDADHVTLKHIDSNGNWVFGSENIKDGLTLCSINCTDGFLISVDSSDSSLFIVDYSKTYTISKYNANGQLSWSNPISAQSGATLTTPKMILDGKGGLFYVWTNQGDMYGMHLDKNGSNVWQTDQELLCTDSTRTIVADHLLSTDDGSIYTSYLAKETNKTDIAYIQRWDASAQAAWAISNFICGGASITTLTKTIVGLVKSDNNNILVVEQGDNLLVQKFQSDGQRLWGQVASTTSYPDLLLFQSDGAGGVELVWRPMSLTKDFHTYIQRVYSDGRLSSVDVPQAISPRDGEHVNPYPTFIATPFNDTASQYTHVSSQWLVTYDNGIALFDSGEDFTHLSQITLPSQIQLPLNVSLNWSVRYKSSQQEWTAWSIRGKFYASDNITTEPPAPAPSNPPNDATPSSSSGGGAIDILDSIFILLILIVKSRNPGTILKCTT